MRRAPSYLLKAGILFRRSFDGVLLRCVSRDEANSILKEVHSGVCGGHQSGAKMYHSIRLAGYYWPKIMTDCLDAAKACHMCQIHGDFKHRPPVPLHPTVPSWPFDAWGIDVIGPFDPPSAEGHRFILAATDYFSRWAEAVPLREVKLVMSSILSSKISFIVLEFLIVLLLITARPSNHIRCTSLLRSTKFIGIILWDTMHKPMG